MPGDPPRRTHPTVTAGRIFRLPTRGSRSAGRDLSRIASGKEVREIDHVGFSMMGTQFTPHGGTIVAAGYNEIIGWDINSGDQRFKWKQEGEITNLSNFFADGKKIACVCKPRRIAVWGGNSGKPIRTLDLDGKEQINHFGGVERRKHIGDQAKHRTDAGLGF